MEIYKAKVLGFCYGVKRAMKIVNDTSQEGQPVVTLGPLIHNPQAVKRLMNRGVRSVNNLEEVKNKEIVIIRSHGVGPSCYNDIKCKNLTLVDATCPFVKRNQDIAKKLSHEGHQLILIGEKNHPELKSIAAWVEGKHPVIIENMEDVQRMPSFDEAHIVIQTTFSMVLAEELIASIQKKVGTLGVHKTICQATSERQKAAKELAGKVNVMIVIGGRNSANTGRLAEVCRAAGARTHHIETAKEIRKEWFHSQYKVGITAGASTPDWIIEEVVCIMEDMGKMLEMEEQNLDYKKGDVINGEVIELFDNRAYVSFGYKTEAVLPIHEYSYPEPESLKDVLKIGDPIKAVIVNGVREDNPIYISKIKLERLSEWDDVEAAFEKGEPVECEGIESIKVGLLIQINSLRGFIPLSQGDLRFVHSLSNLVGKKFMAKILEVDRAKNRLVLSRKAVLEVQRDEELKVIEDAYANGDTLQGTVKKIMPYGAFIGVNGVEGLLHISDISWKKIAKVEDVLQPGEVIDVKIKSYDAEKQRISFTHKECIPNPWETSIHGHKIDDVVDAKVVKILDFGAIVELADGLTGLLHVNEMTNDHNKKPGDVCNVGDAIKVRIIGIDEERRRISFSLAEAINQETTEDAE